LCSSFFDGLRPETFVPAYLASVHSSHRDGIPPEGAFVVLNEAVIFSSECTSWALAFSAPPSRFFSLRFVSVFLEYRVTSLCCFSAGRSPFSGESAMFFPAALEVVFIGEDVFLTP